MARDQRAANGRRHVHSHFTPEREARAPETIPGACPHGRGTGKYPMIKPALEKAPGCPMALSTMYKLLHRQGWRKRAPDKRHPKSDEQA